MPRKLHILVFAVIAGVLASHSAPPMHRDLLPDFDAHTPKLDQLRLEEVPVARLVSEREVVRPQNEGPAVEGISRAHRETRAVTSYVKLSPLLLADHLHPQHRRDMTLASTSRAALIAKIQHELVRSGCLEGRASGIWEPQTRDALVRAIQSANARMPVESPEIAHLALLQGEHAIDCGTRRAAGGPITVRPLARRNALSQEGYMGLGVHSQEPSSVAVRRDHRAAAGDPARTQRVKGGDGSRRSGAQRTVESLFVHPLGVR